MTGHIPFRCGVTCLCVHAQSLCHVQLFVTPWTVAHQASLSIGFPRQDYWSGLPFLLQGIFLTQASNLGLLHLLHWQAGSSPLYHLGSLTTCLPSSYLSPQPKHQGKAWCLKEHLRNVMQTKDVHLVHMGMFSANQFGRWECFCKNRILSPRKSFSLSVRKLKRLCTYLQWHNSRCLFKGLKPDQVQNIHVVSRHQGASHLQSLLILKVPASAVSVGKKDFYKQSFTSPSMLERQKYLRETPYLGGV